MLGMPLFKRCFLPRYGLSEEIHTRAWELCLFSDSQDVVPAFCCRPVLVFWPRCQSVSYSAAEVPAQPRGF